MSFFRNRFYDQGNNRWTQEDPIGVAGGLNLYAYVGNNPVTSLDPFGLCAEGDDGGNDGGDGEKPDSNGAAKNDSTWIQTVRASVDRAKAYWESSIVYAPDRFVERATLGALRSLNVPEVVGGFLVAKSSTGRRSGLHPHSLRVAAFERWEGFSVWLARSTRPSSSDSTSGRRSPV